MVYSPDYSPAGKPAFIEEIEKLERRITRMENIAEAEHWNMMDDIRQAQVEADCKLIEEGFRTGLPKEEILASLVNGALHRIKATIQ